MENKIEIKLKMVMAKIIIELDVFYKQEKAHVKKMKRLLKEKENLLLNPSEYE